MRQHELAQINDGPISTNYYGTVLDAWVTLGMDTEELGARIRRLREGKDLSQNALGAAIGVTGQTVWQWENGQRFPRPENQRALAEVLRVSPTYLMTGLELGGSQMGVPGDVAGLYSQLDDPARRAWIRMGRTLQDVQAEYEALQRDSDEHRLEAEERSRRVQQIHPEDREPIDVEPLAADTGEDLRRAQKRQRRQDSQGEETH